MQVHWWLWIAVGECEGLSVSESQTMWLHQYINLQIYQKTSSGRAHYWVTAVCQKQRQKYRNKINVLLDLGNNSFTSLHTGFVRDVGLWPPLCLKPPVSLLPKLHTGSDKFIFMTTEERPWDVSADLGGCSVFFSLTLTRDWQPHCF